MAMVSCYRVSLVSKTNLYGTKLPCFPRQVTFGISRFGIMNCQGCMPLQRLHFSTLKPVTFGAFVRLGYPHSKVAHLSTDSDGFQEKSPRRHVRLLKLMQGPNFVYPNVLKVFKNIFYTMLVRRYDVQFTQKRFLEGAQQALHTVSEIISEGRFDRLEGLVEHEVIDEIKRNYNRLSPNQREVIAVNPGDILMKFIYDIQIKQNPDTGQRFFEVMTVFHGNRSFARFLLHHIEDKPSSSKERLRRIMNYVDKNFYVCNYRFRREITKEKDGGDWTINLLNHFLPQK